MINQIVVFILSFYYMTNYRRNFTAGGIYFFTVVLQNRQSNLLIEYIDEFREGYLETQKIYPFETIAICILPDHFHLLMRLPENDDNYSQRVKSIKRNFSIRLPQSVKFPNISQKKKNESRVWQRRFWEHLIRDEDDFINHCDYIYYNPVKHGYVESVKDWKYSSFHRDVKRKLYPEEWGGNPKLNINGDVWD